VGEAFFFCKSVETIYWVAKLIPSKGQRGDKIVEELFVKILKKYGPNKLLRNRNKKLKHLIMDNFEELFA
jgi:hypothetical protein